MNCNRTTAPKNRFNRYQYKTHQTNHTDRSLSNFQIQNVSTSKKQLRSKNKKENTNCLRSAEQFALKQPRIPLAQVKDDNMVMCLNLAQYHKKESLCFKKKNGELQSLIAKQSKEIEQLKKELSAVQSSLKNGNQTVHERHQANDPNNLFKMEFENQARQMEELRNEVNNLKNILSKSKVQDLQPQAIQSNISRRAEYAKNYQVLVDNIQKDSFCKDCLSLSDQLQGLKYKYGEELGRLQSQICRLMQKQLMIEVMEKQVQNKNECIDYLRIQIQGFQRNSKNLLNVVNSLEERLSQTQMRKYSRSANERKQMNQTFQSFNGYNF